MNDVEMLQRIKLDSKVMVGKPVISGTRLTVEYILNLLAHGQATEQIVEEYPGLTSDDIQACLLFASRAMRDTTFMPLTAEEA